MTQNLLRFAVVRGGGLASKGPRIKLMTADGQEIGGVHRVAFPAFDGTTKLIEATITALIEIEAMDDPTPATD